MFRANRLGFARQCMSLTLPARAAVITFDMTPLGGAHSHYDHVVTNDTLWTGVQF
jgi:hypothetical protein